MINIKMGEDHSQFSHHFRMLLIRQTGRHDLNHADLGALSFQSLDLDELDAVEFACALEQEFGIAVEAELVEMVGREMSIDGMVHAVDTLLRCRACDSADI